jgi:uncharacterized repeat protein (TIGR01451 family)
VDCTDTNAAISLNPTVIPATFSGDLVTIPSANNVPGATIVCTLTNTRAVVSVSKVATAPGGIFSFTGINLTPSTFADIDVTGGGGPIVSATVAVATMNSQIGVTEGPEPGGFVTSWSCTDANAAITGNPAYSGTGTNAIIQSTGVIAGSAYTCLFTNIAAANVSITKTDNLSHIYSPGGTGTYTIVVTNATSAALPATGMAVTDVLPKGLTIASAITCSGAAGATCSGSGSNVGTSGDGSTNVLSGLTLTLPPGGTVTITIPVTYNSNPANY